MLNKTLSSHRHHAPPSASIYVWLGLLGGLILTPVASADQLNLLNWSDYLDTGALAAIEAATGLQVRVEVYDSRAALEVLLADPGVRMDVIIMPDAVATSAAAAGRLHILPDHLGDAIKPLLPAAQNEHAIDYVWGTLGFGVDVTALANRVTNDIMNSLALLFDPDTLARIDCGISIPDSAAELIPLALRYLGEDPRSDDATVIARTAPLLNHLAALARIDSVDYPQALLDGDICLALGWSDSLLQTLEIAAEITPDRRLAFHIPQEGTSIWSDQLTIPANAPHPAAAQRFIDALLKPLPLAATSATLGLAVADARALPLLPESLRDYPAIYPPQALRQRLYRPPQWSAATQAAAEALWEAAKARSLATPDR